MRVPCGLLYPHHGRADQARAWVGGCEPVGASTHQAVMQGSGSIFVPAKLCQKIVFFSSSF